MSNRRLEEEFFIIDSFNLNNVNQKLYGYAIKDKDIIIDKNININNLDGTGAYTYIHKDKEKIKILQDFNGSYGLYFYKNEDYFAISNSFLKLVEYLKKNHTITFNKKYGDAFLFSDLCSFAYGETLINEIEVLPRNYKVIINKNNKSINFEEIDYQEHTIELNSKEGINTLDKWFYKWTSIIRSIKDKTNNLTMDLSGGFDTRITATLMLSANIDLNKITVLSYDDDKICHAEDYEIASRIGEKFGFSLNKNVFSTKLNKIYDKSNILNTSFYTKLGFHKEMYFNYFNSSNILYSMNGAGGECVRGYPNKRIEEYKKSILNNANKYNSSLVHPSKKIFNSSLKKLEEKYSNASSEDLSEFYYKEVRCRNHYGKYNVEKYFQNRINLSPLLDPILHKIKLNTSECDDKHLLMAVIYNRYCPQLLEFKFEGERGIKKETIEYAKKINEKYEFKNTNYEFISGPSINETNEKINEEPDEMQDVDEILKNAFYSDTFEEEFKKYYPSEYYNKIAEIIETTDYYPLKNVYSSIAIIKVIYDIKYKDKEYSDIFEWIQNKFLKEPINKNKYKNIMINSLLSNYNTCRIDIKNFGNENNSIKIISTSDSLANVSFPEWFKNDEGTGVVIQSKKSYMDFKIKCINDGILNINLKSIDIHDRENNRFPIYIDYTSLKINNEEHIIENKLTWHDELYIIKRKVKNSTILKIHVEWQPFSPSSLYKNKIIINQKEKVKKLTKTNKQQKEEIYKLKRKNKEILNSKSWKITKPLRNVGKLIK